MGEEMTENYDLYCKFDIEKHKQTYIHYLEVVLFPDGHIEYAVPSHQEKLIAIACEKLNVSREELFAMCPEDYFFDVLVWLCNLTQCVSIWTNGITTSDKYELTREQIEMLDKLKDEGILEVKERLWN